MIQIEETDESDSPGTRPDVVVSIPERAWADAITDVSDRSAAVARLAYEVGADKLGAVLPGPEISVLLTNNAQVKTLNLRHRNKPNPTNVLSFPGLTADQITGYTAGAADHSVLLGDVVLAYETVAEEAVRANKPITDHLAHLLAHGVLHLLGFDHTTDDTGHRMESLEVEILGRLGVGDPYVIG